MIALNLNNHFILKRKDLEIKALTLQVEKSTEDVDRLGGIIASLEKNVKESADSYNRLSSRVGELSKRERAYSENLKKVEENVEIKNLLDTRLPDDLRRLLDESVKIQSD